MPVDLRCETAKTRPLGRALKRDAAVLMRAAGLHACELSVALVTDAGIRRLNRKFRNRDGPADVLSFSQLEEREGPPPDPARVPNRRGMLLGDVVISAETALEQARLLGVTPAGRLRVLLVHGFLHLLGYDHERSPAEAKTMLARERALLAALARAPQAPRRRPARRAARTRRTAKIAP